MKTGFLILVFAYALFHAGASFASEDPQSNFDEETNVLHCAVFANGHYTINLRVVGFTLTISILDHDKTAFSFQGNEHTVFAVAQDTLWYLNAGNSAGGEIAAVDLKTGKQLWTQALPVPGQGRFSWYKARRTLKLTIEGVQVHSKETAGEYLAYFDMKTGKQLSYTVLNEAKAGAATRNP